MTAPVVTPGRRFGGFTLLEVLVAFVILAMTMGMMLQIFGSGLRGAGAAREHAAAAFLARSLLDAVGRGEPVAPGVRTGTDGGFDWELEVASYAEELAAEQIALVPFLLPVRIRVTVRWGAADQVVELVTMRLVEPNLEGG